MIVISSWIHFCCSCVNSFSNEQLLVKWFVIHNCCWRSVPVGNRSTTLDHLVRSPTVPRTTTRGACFRVKLYEGVCELYRKNAVTQDILSQRNLFCVVTKLYILSLYESVSQSQNKQNSTCSSGSEENEEETVSFQPFRRKKWAFNVIVNISLNKNLLLIYNFRILKTDCDKFSMESLKEHGINAQNLTMVLDLLLV